VEALEIIERFDVVEDFLPGPVARLKSASIDKFQFEGAPETFHRRVVVAVVFPRSKKRGPVDA
jgi:hypothetical protein